MPITKSAKKALRSSRYKRVFNTRRKNAVEKAIKEVKKFVTQKKLKEAEAALSRVYKALDKGVKTKLIKKNTAARKKSRLSKLIKKIS